MIHPDSSRSVCPVILLGVSLGMLQVNMTCGAIKILHNSTTLAEIHDLCLTVSVKWKETQH